MLLNSLFFIFAFLPIVLLVYYLVPERARNLVLLVANLIFYAWGDPNYFVLLIFLTIFHFIMGRELTKEQDDKKKQKHDLIFAIAIDVFLLCFFKYFTPFAGVVQGVFQSNTALRDLILPIGLSFYTFKNMSYLFDIYYEKTDAEDNFVDFAVYAAFFPAMTAGPIVRYVDIKDSLKERKVNFVQLGYGSRRFILGLAKKALVADTLAALYAEICAKPDEMSMITAWIGMFAFTMQIYFDFSGYSDMAIGMGKMLGFDMKENFDHPYTSKSIGEFWRRWHISLGSWFRDYVYIPLGGNRVSVKRHIINLAVVWCLTGMWHGATLNFPVWGLYYGVLLVLEKYYLNAVLEKLPSIVSHIYTMFFVMVGWMIFANESLAAAGSYILKLFGIGASSFIDTASLYYLKTNFVIFVICIIASGPNLHKMVNKLLRCSVVRSVVFYGILLLIGTACLVYGSYHPFLYLRF